MGTWTRAWRACEPDRELPLLEAALRHTQTTTKTLREEGRARRTHHKQSVLHAENGFLSGFIELAPAACPTILANSFQVSLGGLLCDWEAHTSVFTTSLSLTSKPASLQASAGWWGFMTTPARK